MSPHLIPAVTVLSFVIPLFAIALWLIHGHRKEVEKGVSGAPEQVSTAAPESRSRSSE
jgi:uncharacterized protein with PQ loop repeat